MFQYGSNRRDRGEVRSIMVASLARFWDCRKAVSVHATASNIRLARAYRRLNSNRILSPSRTSNDKSLFFMAHCQLTFHTLSSRVHQRHISSSAKHMADMLSSEVAAVVSSSRCSGLQRLMKSLRELALQTQTPFLWEAQHRS